MRELCVSIGQKKELSGIMGTPYIGQITGVGGIQMSECWCYSHYHHKTRVEKLSIYYSEKQLQSKAVAQPTQEPRSEVHLPGMLQGASI